MISKYLFLLLVLLPVVTSSFRAPENPTSVNLSPTLGKLRVPTFTTTTTTTSRPLSTIASPPKQQNKEFATVTVRKQWGIDNTQENEYWYDSRIHTLGNVGFWGAVHAAMAPISTKIIDVVAYDGIDIRSLVSGSVAHQPSRAFLCDPSINHPDDRLF
jgi:hypothetical protein